MANLDMGTDSYDLYLDNNHSENSLSDDQYSSASDFSVELQPQLDLSSLLYLRSVQAQCAVNTFTVDNLPLCYTRLENITVSVYVLPGIAEVNQSLNSTTEENLNSVPLILPLTDFSTGSPQVAIDYINNLLAEKINNFILYRLITPFLDVDIFKPNFYDQSLTLADIKLALHYVNIAVFSRIVAHEVFCNTLAITNDSLDATSRMQDTRSQFTEAVENKTISDSFCLRSKSERKQLRFENHIHFPSFYNKNVARMNPITDDVVDSIKTAVNDWLERLGLLVKNDAGSLDEKNVEKLKKYIIANKKLIEQGQLARQILNLQRDRKDPKPHMLFNYDFLRLSLDSGNLKCIFNLHPELFLCPGANIVTIEFPAQASYVLGCSPGNCIKIGPLDASSLVVGSPRVAETILFSNQILPYNVCPMPKMIFIASDIATSKKRDDWLSDTPFSDFHLIHSQIVDVEMITNRFLYKSSTELAFFRMQRVNNLLDKFSIKLLDHNFRPCIFNQKCICRISLSIKPVLFESI